MEDGLISNNGDSDDDLFPLPSIKILQINDQDDINTNTKESNKNKKEYLLYKYSKDVFLAESILIDNKPMFLQIKDGALLLNEKIETDDLILVPPAEFQYLSKEYTFSSVEEIEAYIHKESRKGNIRFAIYKGKSCLAKIF